MSRRYQFSDLISREILRTQQLLVKALAPGILTVPEHFAGGTP
jgi:hypothetical protein